jgi:molybdopterin synthase sulfur carrier subunit
MKLLYFASLRERLGRSEEEVVPPATVRTIADLIGWLRGRDETADLAMAHPEIIGAAIDAKKVAHTAPLGNARVVALFPPMTGG